MAIVKIKSTPEGLAFWNHVEAIAAQMRQQSGGSSVVELRSSKPNVAGSIPVPRSNIVRFKCPGN